MLRGFERFRVAGPRDGRSSMKKFNYEGINKSGQAVTGTTQGENEQQVKAQLVKFGFTNITVREEAERKDRSDRPSADSRELPDDFVQRMVDGDIDVAGPVSGDEAEEDEWYRAEALANIRRLRRRENIALVITVIVLGVFGAYFLYNKMTEVSAPEPRIITRSSSAMLSFNDVYVKGADLVFIVHAPNWNGNVRVDFQAWDAFDNRIDFGTARLGFIGEHYGGAPQKSGTFTLKPTRFYERIELLVSGDEGK